MLWRAKENCEHTSLPVEFEVESAVADSELLFSLSILAALTAECDI